MVETIVLLPTDEETEIMRKKELVQIHALLLEVADYLIENEDMPDEALSTYYELDVHPSSIHKSKQDHYDAIGALGDAIEWWTEQDRSPTVDYPVN